jgi:hypothetical protein
MNLLLMELRTWLWCACILPRVFPLECVCACIALCLKWQYIKTIPHGFFRRAMQVAFIISLLIAACIYGTIVSLMWAVLHRPSQDLL